MCEFCTEHGEGKKWYLEMKNYADELLHQELSAPQQNAAGAPTRLEWTQRFWAKFVMPAITGARGDGPFTAGDPEGEKIEHFGQVLPIEDVEQVIDRVDSITRLPCGCRFLTTGKTDQRYCFGLGIDRWGVLGKFPEARASLEVLDKDQAKKISRDYDAEGLMHSLWTGVTPFVVGLCNCDRDCGAYRYSIMKAGPPSFFRAEYICRVEWELCTGCKDCMRQCQFGAIFYSSALTKVHIDPARCYGCGVCRATCAPGAIELLPRQEVPEAAHLW